MPPDYTHDQSVSPASLPALSAQPQPLAPIPAAGQSPVTASGSDSGAARAIVQARQAVARYHDDPYRLNEALAQLRAAYVAEHHHITIKPAEQ